MNFLKKYWREILILILLISLIVSFQRCTPSEKTEITVNEREVKIPEIVGSLEPEKRTELPSAGIDSVKIGKQYIYSTHPLEASLKKEIEQAKDSLEIMRLLVKSAQVKEEITDFSNDKLELKVWTKTQGKLLGITTDFKIKETTVKVTDTTKTITKTVQAPPTIKDVVSINGRVGWLVGGSYLQNIETKKSAYGVNAGIRVQKISVIVGGNTQKQGTITALIEL